MAVMQVLILSILSLISLNAESIRSSFHKNMNSENGLLTIINSDQSESAISKGYIGLAETMMAEYCYLPTSKLSYFNSGKLKIEAAVKMKPNNAEIRYLRLMVQLNAPSFLSYNDDVVDDLRIFKEQLKIDVVEKSWQLIFIDNLMNSDNITTAQKNTLKQLK